MYFPEFIGGKDDGKSKSINCRRYVGRLYWTKQ